MFCGTLTVPSHTAAGSSGGLVPRQSVFEHNNMKFCQFCNVRKFQVWFLQNSDVWHRMTNNPLITMRMGSGCLEIRERVRGSELEMPIQLDIPVCMVTLVTDEKHSRGELEIGNQFGDIARMTGLATLHRRVLALTLSTQCLLILTSQSVT